MRTLYCFIIVSCVIITKLYAQTNLVPNPSFEIYDTCPTNIDQINYAVPWFNPTNNNSTYFNACYQPSSYPEPVGVPSNFEGYQYAHTGNAYSGGVLYYPEGDPNGRTYIEVELTDTLSGGNKYCVEFYISLSNFSMYATDRMGIYISDSSFTNYSTINYLSVTPQIQVPIGVPITDTANWTLVSGEYIAVGGEKYITIGSFYPDSLTTIDSLGGSWVNAYYYIDDVSVVCCDSGNGCTVGVQKLKAQNTTVRVYPNPTTGKFTIQMDNEQLTIDNYQLSIYNVLGARVYYSPFTINHSPLITDISAMPSGIYFYKITDAEGDFINTGKLIIE